MSVLRFKIIYSSFNQFLYLWKWILTIMYQLKISIDAINPPIWRTIQVPETFTLNKLHHIIQIIFDWSNYPRWRASVTRAELLLACGKLTINTSSISLSPKQQIEVNPYRYNFWRNWNNNLPDLKQSFLRLICSSNNPKIRDTMLLKFEFSE